MDGPDDWQFARPEPEEWNGEGMAPANQQLIIIAKLFPVVAVSEKVHELIRKLEMAACGTASCPTAEMDIAYAGLNAARESLYRYLQSVERRARVKRTHIKRF